MSQYIDYDKNMLSRYLNLPINIRLAGALEKEKEYICYIEF